MTPDQTKVLEAAHQRAAALVDGDAVRLRELMHPMFRWTTYRGQVLDRDAYIAGNTNGSLEWLDQTFEEVSVAVVEDAAVLVALVRDRVRRPGSEVETFELRLTQTWFANPPVGCASLGMLADRPREAKLGPSRNDAGSGALRGERRQHHRLWNRQLDGASNAAVSYTGGLFRSGPEVNGSRRLRDRSW